MSATPTASHVSFPEVKSNPIDVSKQIEMETQLEACLDAILYYNGAFRSVTHNLLKRVEEAKATIGEANALFIEGVRRFGRLEPAFEYLSRAEEKGCDHPFLYYFLAECHRASYLGCPTDETKALEYYDLAIKGGCNWMYKYESLLGKTFGKKFFHFYLGLEREGFVDEEVFRQIAECKEDGKGCRRDRAMAMEYYKRAADLGFSLGYEGQAYMLWNDADDADDGMARDRCRAIFPYLEADEKGLTNKDYSMLVSIIRMLKGDHFDKYNTNPIGKFQTRSEMALHYCDVLMQREVPEGYQLKGNIYMKGSTGVPKDEMKAVSIWEEADRMGLATFQIYSELQLAYKEGKGTPVDGMKVLTYAEKALNGITPVSQDGNKVLECCNRALQIISYKGDLAKIYSWMGDVYKEGIHPVVQDGTKALVSYDTSIQLANRFDKYHISKAEVYLKGIHPIPLDGAKALKCYEAALPHIGNYRKVQGCIAHLYEIGVPPIAQDLRKAQDHRHKEANNLK